MTNISVLHDICCTSCESVCLCMKRICIQSCTNSNPIVFKAGAGRTLTLSEWDRCERALPLCSCCHPELRLVLAGDKSEKSNTLTHYQYQQYSWFFLCVNTRRADLHRKYSGCTLIKHGTKNTWIKNVLNKRISQTLHNLAKLVT